MRSTPSSPSPIDGGGTTSPQSRGRVLFADDDVMVLESISRALMLVGFEMTRVTTADEALSALDAQAPDALLLDIEMPGNTGLEFLRMLSVERPLLPVVIFTGRPSLDTAIQAVRLGVVDYITKPPQLDELSQRLDLAIHRGRVLGSIQVAENLAQQLSQRLELIKRAIGQGPGAGPVSVTNGGGDSGGVDPLRNLTAEDLRRLSRRERDVLRELAKGHSPLRMAKTLHLSPNTIRNHLKSIFVKLGVNSQVALLGKLATPPNT